MNRKWKVFSGLVSYHLQFRGNEVAQDTVLHGLCQQLATRIVLQSTPLSCWILWHSCSSLTVCAIQLIIHHLS